MASLPETAAHEVFRVEQWGDTVVVIPRGDAAGFTVQAVNRELATVQEILRRNDVKHLVIDLGAANYFGSIVLGSLVQLGQQIQDKRGRTAMAAASDDMLGVLRLMKLDRMWELFPTVRVALRSVATIPLTQKLGAMRHVAAAVLVIAAVALLIIFFPRIDYGRRYYVEMKKLWREAVAKRQLAGDEEWERFVQRSEHKLEPMFEQMLRRSDAGQASPVELYLMYIIRDYWKNALDRRHPQTEYYAQLVNHNLRCAEALLEGRPVPRGFKPNEPLTLDEPAEAPAP